MRSRVAKVDDALSYLRLTLQCTLVEEDEDDLKLSILTCLGAYLVVHS